MVRPDTRRAVISMGFRVGEWASFLAPILGLVVFLLFAFKPAVTLYVLITGLAIVLLKVVEQNQLSFEIEEMVRRKVNGYYTH